MIDFPLLKTFHVESSTVDFLNLKFEQYKIDHDSDDLQTFFNNKTQTSGYQTENLLDWNDDEYQNFLDSSLLEIISSNLNVPPNKIWYYWTHMLEYYDGGFLGVHNHKHNEDFVVFIYLNDCDDGETTFFLNDHCEEYRERTKIKIMPKKYLGACFSSLVMHQGEITTSNKKIFVAGVRVDLT